MSYRVLLLEDIEPTRIAYRRVLERAGFEVHEASDLHHAREAIENIAFHVACIDLGLDESDRSNYEGQHVLAALREHGVGTRAIVVSQKRGEVAQDIAIDAYETLGLARWLKKGTFGKEEYLNAVSEEAKRAELGLFLDYTDPLRALLHQTDSDVILHRMLTSLRPPGGYAGLRDLLESLIRPLAPIRPHVDVASRCSIDDSLEVTFSFWSKAIGRAVTTHLLHGEDHAGTEALRSSHKGELFGWIETSPLPRHLFHA